MTKKTLAERLKWARLHRELSQGELAKLADVTPGAIGHLETGIRKGSMKLPQIAEALGVSAMWLAEGTGQPFSENAGEQAPPPQSEFTLEWVNQEERELLTQFRSADEESRAFIKQAARHAVIGSAPDASLRRNHKS